MDLARLLQLAIDHGASDLRLSGGSLRVVRVDDANRARPVTRRRGPRARRQRVARRDRSQLCVRLEQLVEGLARSRRTAPAAEGARR